MDAEGFEALAGQVKTPEQKFFDSEHQAALLPPGWSVADLSHLLPQPNRPKQRVELLTTESFIDYVGRYQVGATAIFADEQKAVYTATIDYHPTAAGGGGRGNCDHQARFSCQFSDEWRTWMTADGKAMDQVTFARFLEANLVDIQNGADLLEVALSLQAHKEAAFVSDIRLDNGQTRFRYEETVRGSTRQGDMDIPGTFGLLLPVFTDGDLYDLTARLRYRVTDGKLSMGYDLIRPAKVVRQATQHVTAKVVAGLPSATLYKGCSL